MTKFIDTTAPQSGALCIQAQLGLQTQCGAAKRSQVAPVVSGEEHGGALRGYEADGFGLQPSVEAGKGLVEDEQRPAHGQSAGDGHAALHPS